MARDIKATDKRRLQDDDGDDLQVSKLGHIYSESGEHGRTGRDRRFFYQHVWTSVSADSTVTLTIVTNANFPHGHFIIHSDLDTSYTVELSNATAGDVNGTQDYPFNTNRGKNHYRSTPSFYYDDTSSSTSGFAFKTLEEGYQWSGKFESPNINETVDWLLDDERVYHVKITNEGASSSTIVIRYLYHEHLPSNMSDVVGNGEAEDEYDAGEPA